MVNRAHPTEVKRKRGTLRKDRIKGDLEPISPAMNVTAPPSLADAGIIEWDRTMKTCTWISHSDLGALKIQCELIDRREDLLLELSQSEMLLETSTGYFYSNPLLVSLIKVEDALAKWTSLLGKTPSDRSRLSIAEVKQATTLDALGARRAERKDSASGAKTKSKSRRRVAPTTSAAPTV